MDSSLDGAGYDPFVGLSLLLKFRLTFTLTIGMMLTELGTVFRGAYLGFWKLSANFA
jgi:hypothetical protein